MAGRKPLKLKESDITRLYSEHQIIDKLEILYPCEYELYSLINENNFIEQVGSDEFEIINNGLEILIQNHSELIKKCRYKMNFRSKVHHFIENLKIKKTDNLSENEKELLSLRERINYLTADEYFKFYKLAEILMKNTNSKIQNAQFKNMQSTTPKKKMNDKQIKRKKENYLKFYIGGSLISVQKILDPSNKKTVIQLFSEMIIVNFMHNLTFQKHHDLIEEFNLNQDLPLFSELHNFLNQMLNHPLNHLHTTEEDNFKNEK